MSTITETDRQCARDLLAGFAKLNPDADFMLEQCASHIAAHRERELTEAKALVAERESRLAHIKFLLEPIYGSTNYAPIGSLLERVLDTSDVLRDLPTVAEATGLKGPALSLAEQLHREGHTNLLAKS
jgi:hypothetical protein